MKGMGCLEDFIRSGQERGRESEEVRESIFCIAGDGVS